MHRPPANPKEPAAPKPVPAAKIVPVAVAVPAATYLHAGQAGEAEIAAAPEKAADGKKRMSFWRRLGGGSLTVSVILHVILLALGAIWVFQIIPAEEKVVDFMPTGGGGGDPASQNPTLQKQRMSMTRPNLARIAAAGVESSITLPEPEESTQMASLGDIGSGAISGGLGGSGSGGGKGSGKGKGFGDGMGPGLGQGKGMMNPFGMIDPAGADNALVGTFYDFKRDEDGKPTGVKALDQGKAKEIVNAFRKGNKWRAPRSIPHYTSKTQLSTKTAFFPGVPDTDAGKAFQSPDSEAGLWVAHYSATVSVKEGGTWRFVGWGDNCLIVGINGNVKLDASDHGYTGEKRNAIGSANLPGKPGAALFEGEWFQLKAGFPVTIDILIGDEGGIFAAGVLLQEKGTEYTKDGRGLPNLPILRTGDLTKEEFDAFQGQLPEDALKGPVFLVKPSGKRDI